MYNAWCIAQWQLMICMQYLWGYSGSCVLLWVHAELLNVLFQVGSLLLCIKCAHGFVFCFRCIKIHEKVIIFENKSWLNLTLSYSDVLLFGYCSLCSSKQAFYWHWNKTVGALWLIDIACTLKSCCNSVMSCHLGFHALKPSDVLQWSCLVLMLQIRWWVYIKDHCSPHVPQTDRAWNHKPHGLNG